MYELQNNFAGGYNQVMQFEFLFIGKTTDSYLVEGVEIYRKKLSHYMDVKITTITASTGLEKQVLKDEALKILKHVSDSDFVIVLDELGKNLSSIKFADALQQAMNRSVKKIVFVIGSAYGLDDSIKKRANLQLSFSGFTFTHQMIRLMLMEQVYRAMTILKGEKYHHE